MPLLLHEPERIQTQIGWGGLSLASNAINFFVYLLASSKNNMTFKITI